MSKNIIVPSGTVPTATFEEVLMSTMMEQYRSERVITHNNKICTFVNAKFRIKHMGTGKVTTCDTIGEAVSTMMV